MRGARWILLLLISGIVAAVGFTYYKQRRELAAQTPRRPAPLPGHLDGQAEDWHWTQSVPGQLQVDIRARTVRQEKEGGRLDLGGVRLRMYHKDGLQYDLVESEEALFTPGEEQLYSEGKVSITLGVPVEGEPEKELVRIHTSGVTFNRSTGQASTDRLAEFTFLGGQGRSMGASYDPQTRELWMRQQVNVDWWGKTKAGRPMKIEAGKLLYKEADSSISLEPWATLTRDNSVIHSGPATVGLVEGEIRRVDARDAKGTDEYPNRKIEYSADNLTVHFGETGTVETVEGRDHARLTSTSKTASTILTADIVQMGFQDVNGESVLTSASGHGHSVVENRPVPGGAAPLPDTRILRAEAIEMKMRPGGTEMEEVATLSPGTVDFLPNRPGGRRRRLEGERLWFHYGPANQLESFRSVGVRTRSEAAKPGLPPTLTASRNLLAHFDPKTGELTSMEQWENFEYHEGQRHASADKATMDQKSSTIHLEGKARTWDNSGSTAADRIHLNQVNGNSMAEGRVRSSRQPERKQAGGGMMSGDEPIQAMAAKMESTDENRRIHYQGDALLWQGGNRVQADSIRIDREAGRLVAERNVESQFREQPEPPAKGPPLLTTVRSQGMVYTESDRTTVYSGGALLLRPKLQVKSLELTAVLAENRDGNGSSLERALADGKVEIVQTEPGRTRVGTSEHADYLVAEERVILRGGTPLLVDSIKGRTQGRELTYYADDDRLLVNGVPDRPAASRLRRK